MNAMGYPRISPRRLGECLRDAAESPMASPETDVPAWYRVRWHFLPEGYLSRRSVAAYDAVIPRLYGAGFERFVHMAVVDELRRRGAQRVLQVGCGPGHLLRRIAGSLPRVNLAGVDLSPFMLERAHERLRRWGSRIDLRHADAASLPFGDRSFDAVVMAHFLGHIPESVGRRSLTEAAKALEPGGTLLTLEHRWHLTPALPEGMREIGRKALLGGMLVMAVAAAVPSWQTGSQSESQVVS
jgi:ubiquinone/menaquinone biosynthesis C-methylase UbiE